MSTSKSVRWGIIGAARVNQRLLPAIIEAEHSELVAVASRRPGAAAEVLHAYAPEGHPAATYDDPDALLADERIDAVYLPMANKEHAQWALRAIAAGKHVLCEKPMALTVTDIDAMAEQADKQGVLLMEGFMYRFHPQHARVYALLESGLIGDVRSVRTSFAFMMRPARRYRLADSMRQGGGAMWDIGCYAIHALRSFMPGDPVAVNAMATLTDSGADTGACGTLDYGAGRYGLFEFSFEHARRSEYEIIGTEGGLKCHTVWQLPGDVPVISWWTESGQQCEERLPEANHFRLEIEHFNDCLLNGKKPLLTHADARMNCRVINAALDSIEQGVTMKL
ncbi:MAG: Gfo/Idh/MocA family oxidoreductase [Methylococcales bacterium]|nr:Gfo/Idh/MocA family oxidoreductase [Methylococcales bacterium]